MTDIQEDRTDRMSFWQALAASCGTVADRRNQYRFVAWCIAWAFSITAATAFLEFSPDVRNAWTWALAGLPFVLSIGALMSYLKFLRDADEFIRKIQIEGLASGFGVGIVFTFGYQVLERAGAPPMSATDAIAVMAIGWIAGQIVATWHYR